MEESVSQKRDKLPTDKVRGSSNNNNNNNSSNSSSNSSSSSDDEEVYVPDGGWGWMVCLGSFLVNFILDGTMFSFGVLLLELLAHFGQGKAKTSWIGSSLLGMSMFMGPIVSVLLERFSCRQITVAGTLLSVVAFIISTFSPNVDMLIITYGIIGGIGFCMSFVSAIIVVGLYFKRRRAIATGIAMSGSGLGTFTYAYLSDYLINMYDWRGTILILSGILLNGVICGLLFRPLPVRKRDRSESGSDLSEERNQYSKAEEVEKLLDANKLHLIDRVQYLKVNDMPCRLTVSTDIVYAQKEEAVKAREFNSHYDVSDVRFRHRHHDDSVMQNPMKRKDIFYSGSLARLPHYNSASWTDGDSGSTVESNDVTTDVGRRCETSGFSYLVKSRLCLFKNKIFVLLLLTNVFWTVQSVPLTYIPDLAVSKNIPTQQAAMLISIVGFTNIIGRILSGFITDFFRVSSTLTYTVTLFTASVANFLFPWCDDFASLAVCCAVFGLCMATAVSMRTIVLADHLGIEQLTRVFGIVALFQGVAFMTNAPFAGLLYEHFHSYVMPFSFAGLMYFFSGLSCLAVQCLSRGTARPGYEDGVSILVESATDSSRASESSQSQPQKHS